MLLRDQLEALRFQVAWNELTGTATYLDLANSAGVQPRQGFKYNAWAFAARCAPASTDAAAATAACPATGLAPDNTSVAQGTPGDLVLSGTNADGTYDACPAYNTSH